MPGGGAPPPRWGQQHPLLYAVVGGVVSLTFIVFVAMTKGNFKPSALLGYLALAGIFGLFFGLSAMLWRRFSPPD